ncbi:hypothetical protein RvY_13555 [Ramazzottius varieornatus]|uniref:Uncharacterized protein n=1 Tax=Ramazzottius varieornatus TaxID=947166 RepID=A0A1D1VSB2_RAMVA|nr:hypothetical protein RvY_13555 [Ramazzottius varieornatus]
MSRERWLDKVDRDMSRFANLVSGRGPVMPRNTQILPMLKDLNRREDSHSPSKGIRMKSLVRTELREPITIEKSDGNEERRLRGNGMDSRQQE